MLSTSGVPGTITATAAAGIPESSQVSIFILIILMAASEVLPFTDMWKSNSPLLFSTVNWPLLLVFSVVLAFRFAEIYMSLP